MTITPWTMYWLTRFDDIGICLCILGFILAAVGAIATLAMMNEKEFKDIWKFSVGSFLIGVFLLVFNVFIPSTRDAAAILIIPKIVNNEKVQEIPSKILDLATDWLDALKPKK